MIQVRDLSKTYRMGENVVHALRGVSLSIAQGEFVAIMGPSGSGKSTLAQILGLLDVPSGGSYELNGQEVAGLSEDELAVLRRDTIGFVFQQFNLLPRMSALENVALPLFYSKSAASDRAEELLKAVGLNGRVDHKPNELSGGQQQRVAIARALINRPRVILADEPTGNLDSASEHEILKQLKELNAQGITVLIVTHEEEVGAQANRLIRLRDGKIVSDERRSEPGVVVASASASDVEPKPATGEARLTGGTRAAGRAPGIAVLEHFRQGIRLLAANKIRTALSMLGILIGVAAVVAMLALGRGAQAAIESQLASLGSNLLVLRPGSMRVGGVAQQIGSTTRLTREDAEELKNLDGVKDVGPTVSGRAQISYADKNWNSQVQGVVPAYGKMHASEADFGRFFTRDEDHRRARVALIGTTVVRELFDKKNPIGEMIKINKTGFQVIGILPEKGATGFRDQDDVILVPLDTAMYRLLGKQYVDSIDVEAQNQEVIDSLQAKILDLMYARHRVAESQKDEAFMVTNLADIRTALSSSSKTMSVLLASIAAISLIVGGIGIMNIMLVSVTERTKEIGLRKAIGARRGDILLQFLAEAVVVSVFGGAIGIALGWSATVVLSLLAGWATSVSLSSVLLAFGFSAGIGIVFGIYPARKASELHPIQALRYE